MAVKSGFFAGFAYKGLDVSCGALALGMEPFFAIFALNVCLKGILRLFTTA